jgi:HK97 family phage portal protein
MGWLDGILYGSQSAHPWTGRDDLGLTPTTGRYLKDVPIQHETKAAFDLVPMGVQGRPQYPDRSIEELFKYYTRNEIVYSCIEVKASTAIDPRLMVEERKGDGEWAEAAGHPMRRLLMRPNDEMDESAFTQAYIVSMDVAGVFYAEIVRGANRLPSELHPLNPAKVAAIPGEGGRVRAYQFKEGTRRVEIPAEDMLVRRKWHPQSRYWGLSPLSVALASVDADNAQTDYLRSFFNHSGVPSGFLKLKKKLTQEQADTVRAKWKARYARAWGGTQHDIGILDEDAEYIPTGSKLNELDSESIRGLTEARIAMPFRVPPLIIYAYTGMARATYSNLKEAWASFWDATLTPMYKDYRTWLTWSLLRQFVDEELIYGERIRLNWDMKQVAALNEDVTEIQKRARENFRAGGITLNEYRALIGQKPDPQGDYYLRPSSFAVVRLGEQAAAVTSVSLSQGDAGAQDGEETTVDPPTQDEGEEEEKSLAAFGLTNGHTAANNGHVKELIVGRV